LAEPIFAEGLNCAGQKNDAETRNEEDESFHRKRRLIWMSCVIATTRLALARNPAGAGGCQHGRVLTTRTVQCGVGVGDAAVQVAACQA
jgi:hypothetical protein